MMVKPVKTLELHYPMIQFLIIGNIPYFFQGMPDYRLSLLFRIQSLTELDRSKVSVEEKVKNTLLKKSIVFFIQEH